MPALKNDVIAAYQVLSSLEYQMTEWHKRVKAAQQLRSYYRNSPFAVNTIAVREKSFKKKWWDACQQYHNFKRDYLL